MGSYVIELQLPIQRFNLATIIVVLTLDYKILWKAIIRCNKPILANEADHIINDVRRDIGQWVMLWAYVSHTGYQASK